MLQFSPVLIASKCITRQYLYPSPTAGAIRILPVNLLRVSLLVSNASAGPVYVGPNESDVSQSAIVINTSTTVSFTLSDFPGLVGGEWWMSSGMGGVYVVEQVWIP